MMQVHHIQKPVRDSKGGLYVVVVPLEFHWHYVIIISITYGDYLSKYFQFYALNFTFLMLGFFFFDKKKVLLKKE